MKLNLWKSGFIIAAVATIVGCAKSDNGSPAPANPPPPTSTGSPTTSGNPTASGNPSTAGSPATTNLTDGTKTQMLDGTVVDTCSQQVLADYASVSKACDTNDDDPTSPQAITDFQNRCNAAQTAFSSKYPNIKCGHRDGGEIISICNSSNNPSLQCGI